MSTNQTHDSDIKLLVNGEEIPFNQVRLSVDRSEFDEPTLQLVLTHEGMITDLIDNAGEVVATTADEFEDLANRCH